MKRGCGYINSTCTVTLLAPSHYWCLCLCFIKSLALTAWTLWNVMLSHLFVSYYYCEEINVVMVIKKVKTNANPCENLHPPCEEGHTAVCPCVVSCLKSYILLSATSHGNYAYNPIPVVFKWMNLSWVFPIDTVYLSPRCGKSAYLHTLHTLINILVYGFLLHLF